MSEFSPTPDQIKNIAGEIRRVEMDRLGEKLPPNTTALNAITRALGLGADFRTFKAGFEAGKIALPAQAPTPTAEDAILMSNILIVFDNPHDAEDLAPESVARVFLEIIEAAGLQGDLTPGVHGFSSLMAWSLGDDLSHDDLKALEARLLSLCKQMSASGALPRVRGHSCWQVRSDDRQLAVDFSYLDSGQICTATVGEATWKARTDLGLDDEEAVLLLGGEIEIESWYRGRHIHAENARDAACSCHDI